MDMPANHRSVASIATASAVAKILAARGPAVAHWCLQACTKRWNISISRFTSELARCAEAKFRDAPPSGEELEAHLRGLHLEDLALACACADGVVEAWDYFVATYRGYLRACAAALLKTSSASGKARELADSLLGELYGLRATPTRGSLLRYFHGRSTLKTWLRAVLAQRHVDEIRAGQKFVELGEQEPGNEAGPRTVPPASQSPVAGASDPHRARYLNLFSAALRKALTALDARDADRLRMYYAEEKKLAEIGRTLGEHESSVSRHLEKVRRNLRLSVEEILRTGSESETVNGSGKTRGLSEAEIALCLEYAAEDAPIDLDQLFSQAESKKTEPGVKEM